MFVVPAKARSLGVFRLAGAVPPTQLVPVLQFTLGAPPPFHVNVAAISKEWSQTRQMSVRTMNLAQPRKIEAVRKIAKDPGISLPSGKLGSRRKLLVITTLLFSLM